MCSHCNSNGGGEFVYLVHFRRYPADNLHPIGRVLERIFGQFYTVHFDPTAILTEVWHFKWWEKNKGCNTVT
jgi:hypothetical protein